MLIEALNSIPWTVIFVGLILLFLLHFLVRNDHVAITYGPVFLTTLGIFGCFFGIAIGLLSFNAGNIQESVPALIDGIRTSFWASVTGIFGALLIKGRYVFFRSSAAGSEKTGTGATIDDLARLLKQLNRSLAGADDSTLLSQLKLMRQDNNDRLDILDVRLTGFMQQMAESNSEALIAALEQVIRDFNTRLNEQFGDNFKKLNEAVGGILEWQETYRVQMAEMIEQQTVTAATMAAAARDYGSVVERASAFTEIASKLDALLGSLETQRMAIASSLEQLGRLVDAAANGLPAIETQISEMTRQIGDGVRTSNERVSEMVQSVTKDLQHSHNEMQRLLADHVNAVHQDVSNRIEKMSEMTQAQVVALDTGLTEGLKTSLETLGRQLTTLSQTFVEDYTPLTERLRQVVRMAEAV